MTVPTLGDGFFVPRESDFRVVFILIASAYDWPIVVFSAKK